MNNFWYYFIGGWILICIAVYYATYYYYLRKARKNIIKFVVFHRGRQLKKQRSRIRKIRRKIRSIIRRDKDCDKRGRKVFGDKWPKMVEDFKKKSSLI